MDLLGDLGASDQLTSTRAENELLKERLKVFKQRCGVLTVENESLKAEVELYRSDAASAGTSSSSTRAQREISATTETPHLASEPDHFVKSGDGIYANFKLALFENCHGVSNVLCCSLSNDESILATGGADNFVSLKLWNDPSGGDPDASSKSIAESSSKVNCGAPVIGVDFSRHGRNSKFVAAGCMDGSVHVLYFEKERSSNWLHTEEIAKGTIKHGKYVRCLAWSSTENILATASADGSVQIHKLEWNFVDATGATLKKIESLQLSGPVESLCFREDHLCCYARGSSNLICFDLRNNFAQSNINLNRGPGNACFDDHVSFAVMDISPYERNYLALATDSSRNIIMDWRSGNQVRNLYGHKNDSYSQPKIATSKNGQYLYGNSQHESVVCVWDIATSSIVERLEGHSNPIRDMYASNSSDTLVTTSFDKKTQFWTTPMM